MTGYNEEEARKYMKRAIKIAKTACGHTSPNPMVGCVVVKNGRIISEACHERYGEFHAERNALIRCVEDTSGADLYVTLEPCCHHGKTPPCTDIIIEKKIKRVFVGSLDSNPLVAGHGISILQEHGIEVITGILEEECLKMNEIFFHYITNKTPFTAVKYAMTLDGKIAAYTGDSKWITNEKSREHVHYLRKKYSGIMVGINTVIKDNPMLNCRTEAGVNPARIIVDSTLRFPMEENHIIETAKEIRTIIAYSKSNENECLLKKKCELIQKGIEVISVPADEKITYEKKISLEEKQIDIKTDVESIEKHHQEVSMKNLMVILGGMKIDSVLIEGGGEINASAFEAGIVNKVYAYIAPKIIMGRDAKSPVSGEGIPLMMDAVTLKDISVKEFDGDILVEGYVR